MEKERRSAERVLYLERAGLTVERCGWREDNGEGGSRGLLELTPLEANLGTRMEGEVGRTGLPGTGRGDCFERRSREVIGTGVGGGKKKQDGNEVGYPGQWSPQK